MISIGDAQAQILAACPRRPAVTVAVSSAVGCVLASPVTATENVPPFANTAMDGYAVRFADVGDDPVVLEVVGTLAAGSVYEGVVGADQALRIMTGAPMPEGADAVVMVERTELVEPGRVRILARPVVGANVRGPGEDLTAGQLALDADTALTPAHIGVLASLGIEEVSVFPRPRVGVLSTGDELREGSEPLGPGQIRDSNRPMLLALLAEAGCVAVDLGMVGDEQAALVDAIERGLEVGGRSDGGGGGCDALVTSGGVSVGDFDHVKSVLDRLGQMSWWQVAVKPAKPLAFGVIDHRPVFGLPGNPVSSLVSFELFARPALRQMAGRAPVLRPPWPAVAETNLARRPDGKVHLLRAVARVGDDGRIHVRSAGDQGSHQLLASAGANALVVLSDGEGVHAGETVPTLVIGTLSPW